MREYRQPTPAMVAIAVMTILIAIRLMLPERPEIRSTARDRVTVARVFDGDTFVCTDGKRVRLLGIDAPEVSHGDRVAEHYAEESSEWLRNRIENQVVMLQNGREPVDRYGRRLAWVYDPEGVLINRELLAAGAAKLLPDFGLPPDLEPILRAAEAEARVAGRGMWKKR